VSLLLIEMYFEGKHGPAVVVDAKDGRERKEEEEQT
jgi:hypothetical protein